MKLKKILGALLLTGLISPAYAELGIKYTADNDKLLDSLVKKGVLTEEEAKEVRVEKPKETKTAEKKDPNKPDIKFYGALREFIDYDYVKGGATDDKDGLKLTTFISKVGVQLTQNLDHVSPGLKANMQAETILFMDDPTTGDTRTTRLGNNRMIVGFENKNWKVNFGRDMHMVWRNLVIYGPFEDLYGSPIGEIHNRQGLRMRNASYVTYKATDKVTLSWDHQLSEDKNVDDSNAYGVKWKPIDDLTLTGTYYKADAPLGYTKDNESKLITASYKFKTGTMVNFLASDDTYKDYDTKGYSAFLEQPVTDKLKLTGGYGWRPKDSVKAYFGGADYSLAKNLTLQFRGQIVKADNPINFTTAQDLAGHVGTDRFNFGVGLEWKF
jgi:predicted porin